MTTVQTLRTIPVYSTKITTRQTKPEQTVYLSGRYFEETFRDVACKAFTRDTRWCLTPSRHQVIVESNLVFQRNLVFPRPFTHHVKTNHPRLIRIGAMVLGPSPGARTQTQQVFGAASTRLSFWTYWKIPGTNPCRRYLRQEVAVRGPMGKPIEQIVRRETSFSHVRV
jgi:hypothetical protein